MTGNSAEISKEILAAAPSMDPRAVALLAEMYTAPSLPGSGGACVTLQPKVRIPVKQGSALFNLVREGRFERTLEVGFAYGFSTIWLLAAQNSPEALHVAIDPFENERKWQGVGIAQVDRLEPHGQFRWMETPSVLALGQFVAAKEQFDLVYIDGNHRFDDVLVDFYLADKIVRPGGIVTLDDLWMPSIRSVISFVLSNRSYQLMGQAAENLAVLRKTREDDRKWDHFTPFRTYGRIGASVDYVGRLLRYKLRGSTKPAMPRV